jgi:thiol:disulfide interchange protein DsbA
MRLTTIRSLAANAAVAMLCMQFAPAAQGQSTGSIPLYFMVNPPEKVSTTDKVEVVEIFSYACSHCAEFQNLVDIWRKKLDTNKVEFLYLPSPYKEVDILLARGYFAADLLGVVPQTHHGIFQAIHERGVRVRSTNDVVALYAQVGVPAEQFAKAINDFSVQTKVRRAYDLMLKYKTDSTPTLIVAGKYRITVASAGDPESMLKVADQLISQELTQKPRPNAAQSTPTSRQAPNTGK